MRRKGYLFAAIGAFGWGTTFVATKIVVTAVTPGTFLFARYLIATIVLLAVYHNRPRQKVDRKDWPMIIFISVFGYFFAIWCQHASTALMDASLASLLFAVTPVSVLLMAIPVLGERASRRKLLSIALTVGGALLVIGKAGSGSTPMGIALAVGGILSWSLTSVLIRKTCAHMDVVWLTIYTQIIAAFCCAPMLIRQLVLGQESLGLGALSWSHIIAFLWAGIVSTALANLSWNRALDLIDANTCSLFYAVMPLTAGVLGVLLLGESLSLNFLIGGLIIFAGMVLSATGDRAEETAQHNDNNDTHRKDISE